LSPQLVDAFGWRGALQAIGILIVAIALPLAWFVRDTPSVSPSAEASAKAEESGVLGRGVAPMGTGFRESAFYLLAIGSMCSIAAVGGTNQHLKLFLSLDLKYSQEAAASITSTVLACSIAGRLIMGWLADRIPRRHVMIMIYALVAGSIPLLLADGSSLFVFAVLFWLGLGGEYLIRALIPAEAVRRARARPAPRRDPDRGRRRGGDRADAGRLSARHVRQLSIRIHRPHSDRARGDSRDRDAAAAAIRGAGVNACLRSLISTDER